MSTEPQAIDELLVKWREIETDVANVTETVTGLVSAVEGFPIGSSTRLQESFDKSFNSLLSVARLISGEFDKTSAEDTVIADLKVTTDDLYTKFDETYVVTQGEIALISSYEEKMIIERNHTIPRSGTRIDELANTTRATSANLEAATKTLKQIADTEEQEAKDLDKDRARLAQDQRDLVNYKRNNKLRLKFKRGAAKAFGQKVDATEQAVEANKQQLESKRRTLDDKRRDLVENRARIDALQTSLDLMNTAIGRIPQQQARLSDSLVVLGNLRPAMTSAEINARACFDQALHSRNKAFDASIARSSKTEIGGILLDIMDLSLHIPEIHLRDAGRVILDLLRSQDDLNGSIGVSLSKEVQAIGWQLIIPALVDASVWYRLSNRSDDSSNVLDVLNDGGSKNTDT